MARAPSPLRCPRSPPPPTSCRRFLRSTALLPPARSPPTKPASSPASSKPRCGSANSPISTADWQRWSAWCRRPKGSRSMHRRLEQFERRLAALSAVLHAWSTAAEQEQRAREHRETLAAVLRAGLESAGVDPDESTSLRHLEDPDWPPPF